MNKVTARTIVDRIIEELSDRSGFQNIWEECDDELQDEIRNSWIDIVLQTANE